MVASGASLHLITNNPELLAGRMEQGRYFLSITDEQGNSVTVSSDRRELLQRLSHTVNEALRETKAQS